MRLAVEAGTVLDVCDSTNNLAWDLARNGATSGAWIAARRQTSGRGREGRTWISEDGGLYISFVFRVPATFPRDLATWIPIVTALACLDAVEATGSKAGLKIKWPNDLLAVTDSGLAKVGGILCESRTDNPGVFVVGIGLNCVVNPELSDRQTGRLDVSVERMRGETVGALRLRLDRFFSIDAETRADQTAALEKQFWSVAWIQSGEVFEWRGERVRCLGLGTHGELRIRSEANPAAPIQSVLQPEY